MPTLALDLGDDFPSVTAEYTTVSTGAVYRFDDETFRGTLYVSHADGPTVAIQFGDDDANDINDTFVDIGDWGLSGYVLCLAPHMHPVPHPGYTGADYPLGAIVTSPDRLIRTDPHFWPGFPWRRLAGTYDVFLPMTYYTYRVEGPRAAAWYTAQNVQIIRRHTTGLNVPIHVVGGISFDATGPETQGFVQTVLEWDVIGASYYTFPGITVDQWKALSALR